jgi:hypothetical protein
MSRLVRLVCGLLLPGLLGSCVLFSDPSVGSRYVITTPASWPRVAAIVRDVAARNELPAASPNPKVAKYVQAYYSYTRPAMFSTTGQVARENPTVTLTLYSSRSPLIDIFEYWNTAQSRKHRQVARDLEESLTAAGIEFHKATHAEFVDLLKQHLKN